MIKLIKPTSGNYTAKVRGSTETAVYVVGKTDFLFSHGFSVLESKTLKDTTPQPLASEFFIINSIDLFSVFVLSLEIRCPL